jgi:hypothetical protein
MSVLVRPVGAAPAASAVAAPRAGFTATWPAVAAWATGLVEAALGAGAIVGPYAEASSAVVGALLVATGLVTLVWGGAVLALGRLVAPRAALGGGMLGVVLLLALLLLAPTRTSVLAAAIAMAMSLVAQGFCAAVVRRHRDRRRELDAARSVAGFLLAAAVLSAVVTPALGATQDAVIQGQDGTVPVVSHHH